MPVLVQTTLELAVRQVIRSYLDQSWTIYFQSLVVGAAGFEAILIVLILVIVKYLKSNM